MARVELPLNRSRGNGGHEQRAPEIRRAAIEWGKRSISPHSAPGHLMSLLLSGFNGFWAKWAPNAGPSRCSVLAGCLASQATVLCCSLPEWLHQPRQSNNLWVRHSVAWIVFSLHWPVCTEYTQAASGLCQTAPHQELSLRTPNPQKPQSQRSASTMCPPQFQMKARTEWNVGNKA